MYYCVCILYMCVTLCIITYLIPSTYISICSIYCYNIMTVAWSSLILKANLRTGTLLICTIVSTYILVFTSSQYLLGRKS